MWAPITALRFYLLLDVTMTGSKPRASRRTRTRQNEGESSQNPNTLLDSPTSESPSQPSDLSSRTPAQMHTTTPPSQTFGIIRSARPRAPSSAQPHTAPSSGQPHTSPSSAQPHTSPSFAQLHAQSTTQPHTLCTSAQPHTAPLSAQARAPLSTQPHTTPLSARGLAPSSTQTHTAPSSTQPHIAPSSTQPHIAPSSEQSQVEPLSSQPRGALFLSGEPHAAPPSAASRDLPLLWVRDGHFMPDDNKPVRIIGKTITKKYDGCWPSFKSVPMINRELWWNYFKSHFFIPEEVSGAVRDVFDKCAAKRLRNLLWEARKIYETDGEIVDWIPENVFDDLLNYWEGPAFQKASNANKTNRNGTSQDGRPVAKYSGGSRSMHDTKTYLDKILGREVAAAELFTYTHSNKKDKIPIDEVAAHTVERFRDEVPKNILPYIGKRTRIPDDILKEADKGFVAGVGGVRNGRITGLGNLSTYYMGATSSRVGCISFENHDELVSGLTQESHKLREDIEELKKIMTEQQNQTAKIAKMVAHLPAPQSDESESDG